MKKSIIRALSVCLVFMLVLSVVPMQAQAKTKVKINKTKATIYVGKTTTLKITGTNKKIKWSSSNKKIATVSSKGKVTAKKKGTATITAVLGNVQVKCKVKVTGYTITYKKAGINSPGNVATASGKKKIVLKAPKKSGYTFVGWYRDKTYRRRVKFIQKGNSQNYTLYAKWKKK